MRLVITALALFCAGCASVPNMTSDAGLPIAKSGWRMSGGADFDKKLWFVMFWRPWGNAEREVVAAADKVVLP